MSISPLNQLTTCGYVRSNCDMHVPNDVICLVANFIPTELLPGYERQRINYPWYWDELQLASVKQGHECITEQDKADAKQKEAKLTYGEMLPCAILQLLDKLNASQKTSFHDLGMGTGKLLLQTYLAYNNLKRCSGVEIAKPRYIYAEQHLHQLIEKGYRGRSFFMVEFMETQFFKVVEDVANRKPVEGWRENDDVIAYHPVLRRAAMTVIDYRAIIVSKCRDNNKYVVRYIDDSVLTVDEKYLFIPGTQRVLEIWFGSLFDFPHAFNTDLCMLTADFPASKHPHLLNRICKTPIGCNVFLYPRYGLMKSRKFPWNQLVRCDFNVYDNDRYACSWSQGWRFYIFEHIEDVTKRVLRKYESLLFKPNDAVFCRKKNENDDVKLKYGEIISSNDAELVLKTAIHKHDTITVSIDEYDVFKASTKYKIGDQVSFYDFESDLAKKRTPESITVQLGTIIAVECGYYQIISSTNTHRIRETLVFHVAHHKFKIGENVMAVWPRNARNRDCPNRCTKFRAVIKGICSNAEYQLEYEPLPEDYLEKSEQHDIDDETVIMNKQSYVPTEDIHHHHHVREMWISKC